MDRNKIKGATTPENTPNPGDKHVAAKLAQGLTLVPYYVRSRTGSARAEREPQNEYAADREGPGDSQINRGVRTAYCAWIKLKHGQSLAQAAKQLSEAGRPVQMPARGNAP